MDKVQELERKIADLEYRLGKYHEWLEDAIDRDRHFLLKPAWGIVGSFTFFASMWASGAAANYLFPNGGWPSWLTSAALFIIMLVAGAWWIDSGQNGDKKKLSRLPQWGETITEKRSDYQ
jgi:hypothetical protein